MDDERLRCKIFGKTLKHPLGLAAGFDKDGIALEGWENLGFSFVEVGTVTPAAQKGNTPPRLFRLVEDEALINRMGFNNEGIDALLGRLEERAITVPIGVNIGKNIETPIEKAFEDYEICLKKIRGICDYVVINVSSPNTPGLRELQKKSHLESLLVSLKKIAPNERIFLKISPDSSDQELKEISEIACTLEISGFVATNTTIAREGLKSPLQNEEGGLSGKPLRSRASEVCRKLRMYAGEEMEIIGVGGIFTGTDLYERLRDGANACQIFTALVYRGPAAVAFILQELIECMEQRGISSIDEIRKSESSCPS